MKDFELTKRYIAEKLPINFRQGDSDVLKSLMFKNDNEFLRFTGKEQFLKKALSLYPDINRDSLYEDFSDISRTAFHVYMRFNEYNRIILEGRNDERLVLQFKYSESLVDILDGKSCYDAALPFKALDGLTLHYTHPLWKTYYPPNTYGDHCYVSFTWFDDITDIPENMPPVEEKYQIDYFSLFFPDNEPYKADMPEKTPSSKPTEILSVFGSDINIKELVRRAQYKIIDESDDIPTNEKDEYKKQVDIELDKIYKN